MKKLMLVVALLAVVLVAAVPAIAQPVIGQGFSEKRITSGPAAPKAAVSNTGNNANLCPSVQQTANTGNVANEQGVDQYDLSQGDVSFDGSSITITPAETSECTEGIEQSAAG